MKIQTAFAFIVLLAASVFTTACSNTPSSGSQAAAETAAQEVHEPAGTLVTTPEMRRALSVDLARFDSLVVVAEDSTLAVLGPEYTAAVTESRRLWTEYRTEQCHLLKSIFEGGTLAAVVELECLVYLTSNRLTFIYDHYDFVNKVAAMKKADPAGAAP